MRRSSKLALLTLVTLALAPALAIAAPPDGVAADGHDWLGFCNPAGTWLGTASTSGAVVVATVVPAGVGRFATLGESVADDPTFGGALPAVAASSNRADLRRTGPRTFDSTGIRYGWDENLAVVWIERSETVSEFSPQCDSATVSGLYHYYGGWQDPFGEDLPAYGTYAGGAEVVRLP
ncbi:MAG: hypothetical protein OES32_04365 [Acidobacteriota bacterium]|nr:hypothetical protein [Acidobacteriota bacterium]MDH3522798.1 hypothetical protein [Acidobacteriota bacterium]